MGMLHKRMTVDDLQGVLFTDPSYPRGTWCRYDFDTHLKGWALDYRGIDCVDDGYRFTSFALMLMHPDFADYIKPSDDLLSFTCPINMQIKERLIGADTACVYLGPQQTFDLDEWQPAGSLRTGSDGEVGTVYELSEDGEVVAIVLLGFIDADFGTKESVWEYLKASFEL